MENQNPLPQAGTPFSDVVNILLRGRSINWLATCLGVPERTLRGWLQEGIFPRRGYAMIVQFFGQDVEEFKRLYPPKRFSTRDVRTYSRRNESGAGAFDLSQWRDRFDSSKRGLDEVVRQNRLSSWVTPMLLNSMERNDILVYTSVNVAPPEFDVLVWDTLGKELCNAIKRGAYFLYIFPNALAAADWESKWGVKVRLEVLHCLYRQFYDRALKYILQNWVVDARSLLANRLLVASVSECPFWMPSVPFVYHQTLVGSVERVCHFLLGNALNGGPHLELRYSDLARSFNGFIRSQLWVEDPSEQGDTWRNPSAETMENVCGLLGVLRTNTYPP